MTDNSTTSAVFSTAANSLCTEYKVKNIAMPYIQVMH